MEVAEEYLPRRVEVHGDKSQDIVLDAGERREVEYVIQPIELEEERTFEGEVEIELESDE